MPFMQETSTRECWSILPTSMFKTDYSVKYRHKLNLQYIPELKLLHVFYRCNGPQTPVPANVEPWRHQGRPWPLCFHGDQLSTIEPDHDPEPTTLHAWRWSGGSRDGNLVTTLNFDLRTLYCKILMFAMVFVLCIFRALAIAQIQVLTKF